MAIPFYNFKELHNDEFRAQIKEKISNIIDNTAFVEGEYNDSFEKDFAAMQGSKNCLLVGNGTDALEISLLALGVKAGDKVGVPGITFYATAEAVLNIGAKIVFIDTDPVTGLLDPASLARTVKTETLKAIIPVHIYGLPAPIKKIEMICNPLNIAIIEDAAQAHGTFIDGKPVGSTNNLVTFSFYPTKNLSAFGDAGCILTQDDELAQKIKGIRNHGRGIEGLGRNSRCDHIQAAVLAQKLSKAEDYNEDRKKIAGQYFEALKEIKNIHILPEEFISSSSWHLYPIRLNSVNERKKLQVMFKEKEIGHTPFYEEALSEMPELKSYSGEDENAKSFAGKVLCLPIHPFVSIDHIKEIAEILKSL